MQKFKMTMTCGDYQNSMIVDESILKGVADVIGLLSKNLPQVLNPNFMFSEKQFPSRAEKVPMNLRAYFARLARRKK